MFLPFSRLDPLISRNFSNWSRQPCYLLILEKLKSMCFGRVQQYSILNKWNWSFRKSHRNMKNHFFFLTADKVHFFKLRRAAFQDMDVLLVHSKLSDASLQLTFSWTKLPSLEPKWVFSDLHAFIRSTLDFPLLYLMKLPSASLCHSNPN